MGSTESHFLSSFVPKLRTFYILNWVNVGAIDSRDIREYYTLVWKELGKQVVKSTYGLPA